MSLPHITVCVCTFKRDVLLADLLQRLAVQRTNGLFTFDVVVADNDCDGSAGPVVRARACASSLTVTYCVEPRQNIARARNKALQHARGDLVAFIDDDESPTAEWLCRLFETWAQTGAAGVLGPVLPRFEQEPPAWVRKGRFFDRPRHATGQPIAWQEGRTGNVLFVREVLQHLEPPFRPQFASSGEDTDLFCRLAQSGSTFVWSDEAVVFEFVPTARCTRRYLLRRAARQGSDSAKYPRQAVIKSLVALPCYLLALPALAVVGHHVFIAYLLKAVHHATRLLSVAGVPLPAFGPR
jgi:GT2 family glycosyltransferase